MRIVWTEPALQALSAARAYIARDNPLAAARQVAAIVNAAEIPCLFPQLGRPGRRASRRELVVGRTPYLLPYRIAGDRIDLLRVLHGRQMWPDGFE